MQAKHYDGSYGPIEPYSQDGLQRTMAKPNVQHVEVFEATPENIEYRKKNLGVKKRSFKQPKKRK